MFTNKVIFAIPFILLNMNYADLLSSQELMSYEEYASIKQAETYFFTLNQASQLCYYFGAEHTCDATHPQYFKLQSIWEDFLQKTGGQNCVVLVEGSLRNLHGSVTTQQAIRRAGGEGGLITLLAQQSNIPVECPEPSRQLLLRELQKQFTEEQVAYMCLAQAALSAIRSKKGGNAVGLQEYIEACCTRVQEGFSFELTVDRFSKIHEKLFDTPFLFDDEEFFYRITNPVDIGSVINFVCRQNSIARDLYIVEYIKQLKKQGKHVFVVYGSTHAVMQERALRILWTK